MAARYAHPYDSRQVEAFLRHYRSQFGGAFPVFRGDRFQSGAGLGNILASIGRFLFPIIAPAASTFLGATVRATKEGKSIKEAAQEALAPTVGSALKATTREVRDRLMSKEQSGGRRRRRSKPKKKKRSTGRHRVYKGMTGSGRKRRATKKRSKSSGRRNRRIRYLNPSFANF